MKDVKEHRLGPNGELVVEHYEDGRISAPILGLEDIMKIGPEMFIEKGALEICKKLWDLNIDTMESGAHGGSSYVVLSGLSDENRKVFDKLVKDNQANYRVGSMKFGSDALSIKNQGDELPVNLADNFKMQDITSGFITVKDFLLFDCGCRKLIPNPDHKERGPMPEMEEGQAPLEYMKVVDEWLDSATSPEIMVFDETKVKKSVEEYLKDHGVDEKLYIKGEKRIYHSQFYLDRHNKYLAHKAQNQQAREEQEEELG
jgi:hypothetical protein